MPILFDVVKTPPVTGYVVISDLDREAEGWWNHSPETHHTVEPQFIGFLCLGCGKRHAQLAELIECHEKKRKVTTA